MTMTPDQFFDELDEIFGDDCGYVGHLESIKKMKADLEDNYDNYVLKEDALEYVVETLDEDWITETEVYQELKEENDELKEKLETLREERSGGWVKETLHDSVVKENKKLKSENNDLEEEVSNTVHISEGFEQEVEELRKQNKELREHYDKTTSEEHGWFNAIAAKKFEEYSIENEQLREELDAKEDWVDTNDIAQYWTTPLHEEITILKKKAMNSAFKSARQIKKLKKKISELEGSK